MKRVINKSVSIASVLLLLVLLPPTVWGQKKVFISSPYYNIDIGLNFTGQCGPENDAVFSQYGSVSSFNNMRFVGPQTRVHPCWMECKGQLSDFSITGEGSLVSFQICPDYDPEPRSATVKSGPSAFRPILQVMDKAAVEEYLVSSEEIAIVPLANSVFFRYTDNFSVANPELQWETEIGKGVIESRSVIFHVPLDQLGKGKPVTLQVKYNNGNETGMWDIRIIPVK